MATVPATTPRHLPPPSGPSTGRCGCWNSPPGGRALNVAHIRADWGHVYGDTYFPEPQASASRDLSRIIFATNFGGGEINSYVIGLPSVFA